MITGLPILVLQAEGLRPQMGYLFDRRWLDPFESVVSILWKFARVNGIAGHLLAAKVCASGVDPYDGVPPLREIVQWHWLHGEFGVRCRALRESMVATSQARTLHPHLRYCTRCLNRGYHALVHQFANVALCPIHDTRLASSCRQCQFEIPLRLNALLLGSPYACPNCLSPLASTRPSVTRCRPMQMAELMKMTRIRIGRRLY